VKAVQAFNSAQETSTAAEGLLASSAPHVMMRLRDATLRAAAANKVALKAEQEKEAAEKEKEDLQRELCGKRPRPEASTIEANEEMPADVSDLDLADWRRHATKWWNRSQVQLGSREDALAPRTGKNGYVDHPRLGLIGCFAYWARGSMAYAVSMIAALCVKLGIRPYSCWCNACSRVRDRGYGTAMGWWGTLEVAGCARSKLTVWKEGHFTVEPKVGIVRRAQRMDETVSKALLMVKSGSWGCVQSHDLW